jgi:hypothetical protein
MSESLEEYPNSLQSDSFTWSQLPSIDTTAIPIAALSKVP